MRTVQHLNSLLSGVQQPPATEVFTTTFDSTPQTQFYLTAYLALSTENLNMKLLIKQLLSCVNDKAWKTKPWHNKSAMELAESCSLVKRADGRIQFNQIKPYCGIHPSRIL